MNDNAAMLDNLAFNCSTLSGDLWAADSSKDKEKILMSYLQKVDKELGTIADFKDGKAEILFINFDFQFSKRNEYLF